MGMKPRRPRKHIGDAGLSSRRRPGMKALAPTRPTTHEPETMVDESNTGGLETACPVRADKQHCVCWYDNEPCCACGDDGEGLDLL